MVEEKEKPEEKIWTIKRKKRERAGWRIKSQEEHVTHKKKKRAQGSEWERKDMQDVREGYRDMRREELLNQKIKKKES